MSYKFKVTRTSPDPGTVALVEVFDGDGNVVASNTITNAADAKRQCDALDAVGKLGVKF